MINSTGKIELSLCSEAMRFEENSGTKFVFHPHFFLSVNAVLSLSALFGNVLILIALQRDSPLHPPSKLLFRCLSSTDLCVGLISQPIFVVYLITVSKKNWHICGITEGLAYVASCILCGESISVLTAISVDRLLALLLRLRYRQVVTLPRVRLFLVFSWFMNFAFSLTYLWNKHYFFLGGCGWILLCLSISTCCYTKIYLTLRTHQAQIRDLFHGENVGTSRINMTRYKKTVSSALWIHSVLLLCYLPYTISTAVTVLSGLSPTNVGVWNATGILVFFNSTLNPIIYCWKIREVRHAVKQTVKNIFAAHNG